MGGEPADHVLDIAPTDLPSFLAARKELSEAVTRWLLAHRLHRQHQRELATGPETTFNIGDTVMLLRPPKTKMTQGAVAPYVVVGSEPIGAFYNVDLMGPDGKPMGTPTRAAASQLRPFDMSRTTPEKEWLRLQREEFQDDSCPIRAVTDHRPSRRRSRSPGDLEFEVVWITPTGDVIQWEPARHLSAAGNVDFKDYIRHHRLVSLVREQVKRERVKHPADKA